MDIMSSIDLIGSFLEENEQISVCIFGEKQISQAFHRKGPGAGLSYPAQVVQRARVRYNNMDRRLKETDRKSENMRIRFFRPALFILLLPGTENPGG